MRVIRLAAAVLAILLAVSVSSQALGHEKGPKHFKKGQVFCPTQVLIVGSVVVQSGRCYVLAVLRDGRGTFLAFVSPKVKVPAKVIRLDSSDGRKIRAAIIYLVPIQATGLAFVAVPVNTIQLVQVQERHEHEDKDDDDDDDDDHEKVVLIITGIPIPNLTVTFVVRF